MTYTGPVTTRGDVHHIAPASDRWNTANQNAMIDELTDHLASLGDANTFTQPNEFEDAVTIINVPAGPSLVVNGADDTTYTTEVQSSTTSGHGYGLLVRAGTGSGDYAVMVENAGGTVPMFSIDGAGGVLINPGPAGMGNTNALVVKGSGNPSDPNVKALAVYGGGATGHSNGIYVSAGTTVDDAPLDVVWGDNATNLFTVKGDKTIHAWVPVQLQEAGWLYSGSGAPTATPSGTAFYLRTDTPGTANQRLYVWNGSAWTGIL